MRVFYHVVQDHRAEVRKSEEESVHESNELVNGTKSDGSIVLSRVGVDAQPTK